MLTHNLNRRSFIELSRRRFRGFSAFHESWRCPTTRTVSTLQDRNEGNPRLQLNVWYQKNHGKSISNQSSFQFDDHFHDGKVWWTARFVCPLTQRVYEAGVNLKHPTNNPLASAEDKSSIHIYQDKVFYKNLKSAIQAASFERLKEIELEKPECNSTHTDSPVANTQLSKESVLEQQSVSQTRNEISSQTEVLFSSHSDFVSQVGQIITRGNTDGVSSALIDSGGEVAVPAQEQKIHSSRESIFPQENVLVSENAAEEKLPPSYGAMDNQLNEENRSPLHLLYIKYAKMQVTLDKEKLETELYNAEKGVLWTASLTCPISEKKYLSGTLRDEKKYGKATYVNGKVYYSRIKTALHAAAAMALDDLEFQTSGNITSPKWCVDDPIQPPEDVVLLDEIQLEPQSDDISMRQLAETSLKAFDGGSPQEENTGLVLLPSQTPVTTLQRVVVAWANSLAIAKEQQQSQLEPGVSLQSISTRLLERQKISRDAASWLTSEGTTTPVGNGGRYKTFQYALDFHNVESYNAILRALARANEIKNGLDVQNLADQIMEKLWINSSPNAETYCAYFRCLHGEPKEVALTAEKILQEMINGKSVKGESLPAPTLDVFNTVIQLWAYAGETEHCERVRGLLNASGFEANRDTIHSVLLSLCIERFNTIASKQYLEQVQSLGSLDSEIYCAPLRWSGKRLGSLTLPWDNYAEIFCEGFKASAGDNANEEADAEGVESWVSSMEGIADVTTVCYEAIIQAWVRTGTMNGLLRAEAWAQRLLDDSLKNNSMKPRLQCLFPILAAWALGGSDPTKVAEWIEKLQACGIAQGDGRISSILILSLRRRAELLLESNSKSDLAEAKLVTHKASDELTRLYDDLDKYRSAIEERPTFLDNSAVCDAIRCIGSYGKKQSLNGDRSEAIESIRQILRIVSRHQRAITSLNTVVSYRNQTIESLELESFEENYTERAQPSLVDFQLQHLLEGTAGVFSSSIDCLNGIVSSFPALPESDMNDTDSSLSFILPDVESMVRYSSETSRFLGSLGDKKLYDHPMYADEFSILENCSTNMASDLELYSSTVDFLSKPTLNQPFVILARILSLLVDLIIGRDCSQNDTSLTSDLVKDILKILSVHKKTRGEEDVFNHIVAVIARKESEKVLLLDSHDVHVVTKSGTTEKSAPRSPEKIMKARAKTHFVASPDRGRVAKSGTEAKASLRRTWKQIRPSMNSK